MTRLALRESVARGALAAVGLFFFQTQSFAQQAPAAKPAVSQVTMPAWELLSRTEASVPVGTVVLDNAASLKGAPATNAMALAKRRYVEEEYLVSGTANIYGADATQIATPGVKYATRVLVRRPLNAKDFYGTVEVEALSDGTEDAQMWRAAGEYFIDHGDVWVGFTASKASVEALKAANAARYGRLEISDERLRFDIQAQVALMVRAANGPLGRPGLVKQADAYEGRFKVYASGWGPTGCMQAEFINKGHHARARRADAVVLADVRPNGRPLFDGYVIGSCPASGPIQPIKGELVAIARVMSESDYTAAAAPARRDDANVTGEDWFRWYDIAGASDRSYADLPQLSIANFQLGKKTPALDCGPQVSKLPGWSAGIRAVYANLDFWIRTSKSAPEGKKFELNPDGTVKRDANGNALGGVRAHWVDLPVASTAPGAGACAAYRIDSPLSADQLVKLYHTKVDYVSKVEESVFASAAARYLQNEDATRLRDAARATDVALPAGTPVVAGVSGRWSIQGNISGILFTPQCQLRQLDNNVLGTCTMEGYEAAVKGTVAQTRVNFSWPFKPPFNMAFDGTIGADNAIKGVVKTTGAEGQWTATRK